MGKRTDDEKDKQGLGVEKLKDISGLKKICQNVLTEKDDWYERIIVRKISIYLSRVFIVIGASANLVTALSFIAGMIGVVLIGLQLPWIVLCGCVMLQFWYLLDKCDGEVARYWKYKINNRVAKSKLESDLSGVFLDYILHYIVHSLVFVSIGFGLYQKYNNIYTLGLCFSAALSMIFINLIIQCKDSIILNKLRILKVNMDFDKNSETETRQLSFMLKMFSFVHYLCTFPFIINIMMICGVLNLFTFETEKIYFQPFIWFLLFYGIISPMVWISKFLFYVFKRKIDSEFNQIAQWS